MGYLRKNSAVQHTSSQSAGANKTYRSPRRTRRATLPSPVAQNGTKPKTPSFHEDFMLEHCRPGTHVTLVALSGCF
jgi:hypothetical protein